jgi:hypothetical protein
MKHLLKSLINIIKTKTYNEDLINSINFDIIDNKEIYNKLIYIYSIFEKYIEAINLFNKYKHIFIQDEGTLFCMIKIYYLVDNITEAENILKNFKFNVNIRHYYYILKYYSENDKKKLIDIYNHTYKNLKLKLREEEIELFVKPELKIEFLYIFNNDVKDYIYTFSLNLFNKINNIFGTQIEFIDGYNEKNNIKLELIDISSYIRQYLYNNIIVKKKHLRIYELNKYFNTIDINNINYIIDGANIGYSKQTNSKIKQINYKLIDDILKQLNYKVILFLHKKHNNKKYIEKWTSMNILYRTDYEENDDIYWIYSSLYLKIPVITNDILRDHYYKLEHNMNFDIWRTNNIIKYKINYYKNYSIILDKLPTYSNRNQTIYIFDKLNLIKTKNIIVCLDNNTYKYSLIEKLL